MRAHDVSALAPCGIRHVHTDRELTSIERGAGENSVYAVFWRDGRPEGFQVLTRAELPVPAGAVLDTAATAVARQRRSLTPPDVDESSPMPTVTIAVCTRDRPDDLRRCLRSIAACEPPPQAVLVVDNGTSPDTEAWVTAEFPDVVFVRESRPGLSRARNRALGEAQTDVIAFTDDDVEVPRTWVSALTRPFADRDVACVLGLVIPAKLDHEAACLFEFVLGGLGKGLSAVRYTKNFLDCSAWKAPEVWGMGAGANMAIRCRVVDEVGPFDVRLGAGAAGCSEDSEFWFRLLLAQKVCVYDPTIFVFHHHRESYAALLSQLRAYTRGHVVALVVQFSRDWRVAHLIRIVVVMPAYLLVKTISALAWRDHVGAKVALAQVHGLIAGILAAPSWMRYR